MPEIYEKTENLFRRNVLSILIPVYNEISYLRRCVNRIIKTELPRNLEKEIIIVDDFSTDGTDALIAELQSENPDVIHAYRQEKNMGKGAAIRLAVSKMTGQYAIFQDADLEYDPSDYAIMLQPILEGSADVVYGSRFASRTMRRVLNYHHAIGNRFLTHLSNLTTGLDLTDMETCFKAFRSDILKTIPLRSNRFGIEPEITAKISKRGCVVYEVPISYRGRSYLDGKKVKFKDGIAAVFTILKYWLIDDSYNERFGEATLKSLSEARRFHKWIVEIINPYLGSRIIETGAGLGNISRYLPTKEHLTVTDIDPVYLEILNEMFADHENVDVAKLDLNLESDFVTVKTNSYDTIICLNVLEHIEDDFSALLRLKNLLEKDGKLILLVPQYQFLYGSFDRQALHFRRYNKKKLLRLIDEAGLDVIKMRNFNFLPIFGWWLNACVLKKNNLGKLQLKFYDMLVPLIKIIERSIPLPGISLICIAGHKREDF